MMNKKVLLFSILLTLLCCGRVYHFENKGCLELTDNGFECKVCDSDFTLENGICRMNDFDHEVKSDCPYFRVYVGHEISERRQNDSTLSKVIEEVRRHPLYQPHIVIVREKSSVQSRLDYRVICEAENTVIDFFVFYILDYDLVKVIDVNVTEINSGASIMEALQSKNPHPAPENQQAPPMQTISQPSEEITNQDSEATEAPEQSVEEPQESASIFNSLPIIGDLLSQATDEEPQPEEEPPTEDEAVEDPQQNYEAVPIIDALQQEHDHGQSESQESSSRGRKGRRKQKTQKEESTKRLLFIRSGKWSKDSKGDIVYDYDSEDGNTNKWGASSQNNGQSPNEQESSSDQPRSSYRNQRRSRRNQNKEEETSSSKNWAEILEEGKRRYQQNQATEEQSKKGLMVMNIEEEDQSEQKDRDPKKQKRAARREARRERRKNKQSSDEQQEETNAQDETTENPEIEDGQSRNQGNKKVSKNRKDRKDSDDQEQQNQRKWKGKGKGREVDSSSSVESSCNDDEERGSRNSRKNNNRNNRNKGRSNRRNSEDWDSESSREWREDDFCELAEESKDPKYRFLKEKVFKWMHHHKWYRVMKNHRYVWLRCSEDTTDNDSQEEVCDEDGNTNGDNDVNLNSSEEQDTESPVEDPVNQGEDEVLEEPVDSEEPVEQKVNPTQEPVEEEEGPISDPTDQDGPVEEEDNPIEEPVDEQESVDQEQNPIQEPSEEQESPVQEPAEQEENPIEEPNDQGQDQPLQDPAYEEENPVQEPVDSEENPVEEEEPAEEEENPIQEPAEEEENPIQEPAEEEESPVEEPAEEEESPVEEPAEEEDSPAQQEPTEEEHNPAQQEPAEEEEGPIQDPVEDEISDPTEQVEDENTNNDDSSAEEEVIDNQVYITVNSLSPELFTQDIVDLVTIFSSEEGEDLLDNIVHIEYHENPQVAEYVLTARYNAAETVQFFALRVLSTNETIQMGRQVHPHDYNAYDQENLYLTQPSWQTYEESQVGSNAVGQDQLFTDLAAYIVANNGSSFGKEEFNLTERHFPSACYFIAKLKRDHDVAVVAHLIRNNTDDTFRTLIYTEQELEAEPPAEDEEPIVEEPPAPEEPQCCTTLEEKKHACVDHLKHEHSEVPYIGESQLVEAYEQILPSGVSFDFYLEYASPDVYMGYESTVARYDDGTFVIVMFLYG